MADATMIRLDKATMPKFERTTEGYLRGRAVVSRIGVFRYQNADGTERLELRHPSEVLSQESLDSLKQIPLTLDHPSELVNSDNVSELAVGYTGDDVKVDGNNITVNFTVTHADAIQAIESGKRELSLGYNLDLRPEAGNYDGQEYTHRQTGIKYNHLAVVAKARAGAEARIRLDGASVLIATDHKEDIPMTVKVNLDGIEYDAAPEVKKALDKATERADAAEKKAVNADKSREDMQKEYDGLQAKMDSLKEEMDAMKDKNNDEAIAKAAKERVELLTKAGKLTNADELSDKTPREIMESAIKSRNDKLDLSDKSDDYVAARFDAAIEAAETGKAKTQEQGAKMGARADGGKPPKDHRADATDVLKGMWKTKQKEAV